MWLRSRQRRRGVAMRYGSYLKWRLNEEIGGNSKKTIFLVEEVNHQITGAKFPSNRQILAALFFNFRNIKLTVSESAFAIALFSGEKQEYPQNHFQTVLRNLLIFTMFGEIFKKKM